MLKAGDSRLPRALVQEGLTAVVAVHLPDPVFAGATKERLGNPGVTGIVSRITGKQLSAYFQQHPAVAQAIIEKAAAARAGFAAQKKKPDSPRVSVYPSRFVYEPCHTGNF